ncbi:8553_t:CDS:2 [Entrophospora sp. SA101]|nr:8553_t:CDS:2 [Entrophospora sp. SA101]
MVIYYLESSNKPNNNQFHEDEDESKPLRSARNFPDIQHIQNSQVVPAITDDDPTNGKLDQSSFVNLVTTNQNTNELSLKLIESAIDTSWFQKYQLENESIIEDDNQNVRILS